MVAKIESIKNIHIMDAPAGSGKTYHINKQLSEFLINNPHSKALAITYTNRAADQIKKMLMMKEFLLAPFIPTSIP